MLDITNIEWNDDVLTTLIHKMNPTISINVDVVVCDCLQLRFR